MIKIRIRKEIGKKKYLLLAILSFVVIIALWTLASVTGAVDEIFLPNPAKVIQYKCNSRRFPLGKYPNQFVPYPIGICHCCCSWHSRWYLNGNLPKSRSGDTTSL